MSELKVGDLCVTQNTTGGLINDGLLVAIIDIDSSRFGGVPHYLIRCVDGSPIPATQGPTGGIPSFYADNTAWAPRHKLRPVDGQEVLRLFRQTRSAPAPA